MNATQTHKSFATIITPAAPVIGRPLIRSAAEPSSPKSMKQSIFESTSKKSSARHWSYRSHPRTPKVTINAPTVKFQTKPEKGFVIGSNEAVYPTIEAAKERLKELNYLRFRWMGQLKMVG